MIVANINNIDVKMFSYSKNLTLAFKFIKENDLDALPLGKTYLDGEKVYINKMTYVGKDISEAKIEGHNNYLDIQLVIDNEEKMGYVDKNKEGLEIISPYDPLKDRALYKGELDALITLRKGFFALVFPNDLHQPNIKINNKNTTKTVFKVKIDF